MPMHWPDDGSLAANCTRYRAAGVWAVDTVNGNAWRGTSDYLRHTSADVVVAQETRVTADHCTALDTSLLAEGWRAAIVPCLPSNGGGKSAGTMVAVRRHIGLGQAAAGTEPWPQLQCILSARSVGGSARRHHRRHVLPPHRCWRPGQSEPGRPSRGRGGLAPM